jgi:uncharacterized membrane protein
MEFVILIIFGFWIYSLSSKVDVLKREVEQLKLRNASRPVQSETVSEMPKEGVGDKAAPIFADRPNLTPQDVPPEVLRQYIPQVSGDFWGDHAIEWVKKDFMVKLGAFLLLLALGWFVSYAIANEWIGPMGQILLGLLAGVAFMALGLWRIETHAHQGGIFTVLGGTAVLLTMYAAREVYGLFDQYSALFIMTLSVVFVAFMSVRYNRNALALSGLVLAAIAPLLTAAPMPDVLGLFVYLTIIVCGTLWVVYLRGWSNLTLAALVIVFLHGLPHLVFGIDSGDKDIALLFSFFFTAVFFVANITGLICNENEENRQAHIAIGLLTGLYLIAWVTGAAPKEWQSLLYVMWMLVFSTGSFIVYRTLTHRVPFYIYGGTSIVLLAAATAAELSGPILTLAYTVEIALLVFLTAYVLRDVRVASRLSLLFLLPVALSFESLTSSAWSGGVFHDDFFVILVLGVSLAVVGRALHELRAKQSSDEASSGSVLVVCSALYGLALIWLVLHAVRMQDDTATMFSLIIYTLIGLVLYVYGKRNGRKGMTLGGGVLLGFVVLHLLFVEVATMETTGRIITFVVIGLLLMSTAFIRKQISPPTLSEHNNTTV